MSTHPVSRRLLHTLWNVPSSAFDSGVTRLGVCGDADTLQLITRGIVWKVERDEMAAWENFFLILMRCLKEELIATSESGHSLVIYVCPKFGHDCLYWCVKVLLPTDMHTTANSILAWNCLSCFFFPPNATISNFPLSGTLVYSRVSQTSPWDETHFPVPTPTDSDSFSLGWSPGICTFRIIPVILTSEHLGLHPDTAPSRMLFLFKRGYMNTNSSKGLLVHSYMLKVYACPRTCLWAF